MKYLYVCTGNVYRSPAAELIHRYLAPEDDVSSAAVGANARPGHAMARAMRNLCYAEGLDPGRHASRLATKEMLLAADRVLYMQPSHRADIGRIMTQDHSPAIKWAPPPDKYQCLASYVGSNRIMDPAFAGPGAAVNVYNLLKDAVSTLVGNDVWT